MITHLNHLIVNAHLNQSNISCQAIALTLIRNATFVIITTYFVQRAEKLEEARQPKRIRNKQTVEQVMLMMMMMTMMMMMMMMMMMIKTLNGLKD